MADDATTTTRKSSIFNLKYFPGAQPGKRAKLAAPQPETVKKSRQEYEQHRVHRRFDDDWKRNRPWLHYDSDSESMSCSVCKAFHGNQPSNIKGLCTWITGSKNLRLSNIKDHEKSSYHERAIAAAVGTKTTELGESESVRAICALKQADYNKWAYLMRNAHAVAKQGRPIRDFSWICALDQAKAVEIGTTHTNEKSAKDFIGAIADVLRCDLGEKMDKAPFFSFIMDGATDISGLEQESMYVRTCMGGLISTDFLCIGTPLSTTSQHLCEYTKDVFKLYKVDETKLIGSASDGANNMAGVKKGLMALLRNDHPELFSTHCLAHRLELAFKDAMKDFKVIDKVQQTVIGLYYFYYKSNKQRLQLKRVFNELEIQGVYPPRAGGTTYRWLPHLRRAVGALVKSFPAYEAQLSSSSHTNSKAEGLYKLLTNQDIIACVLLLQDILEPMCALSLKLQTKDITLADASSWITTTLQELDACQTRQSEVLTGMLESGCFHGVKLKGATPKLAYKCNLITQLKSAITDRMCSKDDPVVKGTVIRAFKTWPLPDANTETIEGFGSDHVLNLCRRFPETIQEDADKVLREWRYLKRMVYERFGDRLHTGLSWKEVHVIFGEDFPAILRVMDLIGSLPPTSVDCEVSFSHMKLVKTERRHNLTNKTLNDLLKVKLCAPPIAEFNPRDAVMKWWTPGRRTTYKTRTATHIQGDSTEESQLQSPTESSSSQSLAEDETQDNEDYSDCSDDEAWTVTDMKINDYVKDL